ncbi:unnamed protein product [Taenia asiatica]|uniref:KH domain-containing protein n=1 Tax=Taenia asiatica TaxID=60517 RepID=A0A0R3W7C2_TAEAS|nr:unnamed protein product [Taenia asiatica]
MSAVIHVIKLFCREFAWLTGSLLKITRYKLPNSTDRILFIYGTVAAITTCLEMICALVREDADALNDLLACCAAASPPQPPPLPPPLQLQAPASQTTYAANATLFDSVLLAASKWEVRRDMIVANDLIGCVIGRGGMKINEIRKASQATIWISNDGNAQHCSRLITIIGSPMAVDSAIGMIHAR